MFNKITEGLVKAIGLLANASKKPKISKRPKYSYSHKGVAIHLSVCRSALNADERALSETGARHLLPRRKVKPVQVLEATLIDHSRYPGHVLREIRKTGGERERNRRLARMQKPQLALAAE